jgi:hypothetical protein
VAVETVTAETKELSEQTLTNMGQALQAANKPTMPDPNPDLAKLGSKQEWLKIYENMYPSEPKVWPPDIAPEVNVHEIKKFLDTLEYPLYFFDYETMQGLVPYFDGQRPYQQVPFQYSLHVIREPGGEVEHTEYLHSDTSNPAPKVAARLVEDVGTKGSIITWNMSFEKSVNEELARMHPEYAERIAAINARVVDLMTPFKAKWYNDPRFIGSASIKKVLPVLCPELSYKELGIQEGNTAQRLWMEAVLDGKHDAEKQQIFDDLLKYCKLDTLAMVEIYKKLNDL